MNDYFTFIAYLLVVGCLGLYGLHRYFIIFLYIRHRNNLPRPQRSLSPLPRVTIQLPLYNERYVAERLLKAVSEIDYPRERLEIQVLDDSTDVTTLLARQEAERLQAEGFSIRYLHRRHRRGFKAGALEEGLAVATGEFLLILDADFVPPPAILHETIHYFSDPKVAMVQARWGHLNRDDSLLTRIQAMFLDGHLVLEQTARSRSGRLFNFNGTAGIWRKRAIVEAGGWQHDTLTEDLDLSYRAQLAGWRFIFLRDLLAPAELPTQMNGFRSQQHRWAKGSIQTCKKLLLPIWKSPIPLRNKIEATIHLTSNFAYLLIVALCLLLFQITGETNLLWNGPTRFLYFDLPIFLLASCSAVVFYAFAQYETSRSRTQWIKNLFYLPLLLALGVGMAISNSRAVLEALFNHQTEFTRTPKRGSAEKSHFRYSPPRSFLPIVELGFAIIFLYFIVKSALAGQWTTLPFLFLFPLGFSYVAGMSLWKKR